MKKIFCSVLPRITASFGLLTAMTLHATSGNAANMITNGNFELGVSNFTSDYTDYTGQIDRTGCASNTFGNPCTMAQEQYAVDTNSDDYDVPYFKSLGDHTSGWDGSAYTGRTGKYFISDASGDTSLAPWISEQTINITSTTTVYRFEAWISDINGDPGATAQPSLQFEIGDGTNWVAIGTPQVLPANKTDNQGWTLVAEDMTFNGTGLFYVRLRNNTSGVIGNDFGLDDVLFDVCAAAPSSSSVTCSASAQAINLGTLSAPLATQTITFANPGSQTIGNSPALTATATSSLSVAFTSATPSVCTITTGGTLTLLSTGTCTIHADQSGDSTYQAASRVSQTFSVVAGATSVSVATPVPVLPLFGLLSLGGLLALLGLRKIKA